MWKIQSKDSSEKIFSLPQEYLSARSPEKKHKKVKFIEIPDKHDSKEPELGASNLVELHNHIYLIRKRTCIENLLLHRNHHRKHQKPRLNY